MYCKDYMRTEPITVLRTAPVKQAVAKMIESQHQHILVVDEDGAFVGEIDAHQFSKLLVPATAGPGLGWITAEDSSRSAAQSGAEIEERLKRHMDRPVADFVDHDVPVAFPDMPIADVFMLLRGGAERMPVVDPNGRKLVGSISMLTLLSKFSTAG